MSSERVTACLIVQDEQERLPGALASIDFCDEVIVVDGGSKDRTREIARQAGARVIENPWPGYARQRNVAIDAATSEWILQIDADERISPELRSSIRQMLAAAPADRTIAVFARRNRFLGRQLGPSAKYPTYRTQLFRRGVYRHDERRTVHEGIEPRERPLILEGDLEHELAGTLGEAVRDTWRYAVLESRSVRPTSARGFLVGILVRPALKLIYRSLLDGGWRDGWQGLLRVTLDAASDALVWMLVLGRHLGARARPASGETRAHPSALGAHFGARSRGPAKIVAIARRGRDAQRASRWLARLKASGLDVALVSDSQGSADAVPTCSVPRLWPPEVRRALEIEMDLRRIDAVIALGASAAVIRRLLPPTLRPTLPGLSCDLEPARAVDLIARAREDDAEAL